MLGNPFLVPSRCKLNHISLCFIQISTKSPAKLLIPFRESTVFLEVIPGVLGRSVKFQHNIKISIKTAHVSRLLFLVAMVRSSRSQIFSKISVLKNFVNFTGKYLCWSLFLIKFKQTPTQVFSRDIL